MNAGVHPFKARQWMDKNDDYINQFNVLHIMFRHVQRDN